MNMSDNFYHRHMTNRALLCLVSLWSIGCIKVCDTFLFPENSLPSLCNVLSQIDCKLNYAPEGDERTCGSDGIMYENFCTYSKARCANDDLSISHVGPCPSDDKNVFTTQQPSVTTTVNMIEQVFCTNSDLYICSSTLDPICGTDFKFYQNSCHFAKEKCINIDLSYQDLEHCKTQQ